MTMGYFNEIVTEAKKQVARVIVGQSSVIDQALIAVLTIHLAYNNWQLKRTFVSVQGIITLLLVTMGMLVTASHICGVATSVR